MRLIPLSVEFRDDLEPKAYFDDWLTNDHEDATQEDCAEQARAYIEERGLSRFLSEWGLDDFTIYVGSILVASHGRACSAPTTRPEDSPSPQATQAGAEDPVQPSRGAEASD